MANADVSIGLKETLSGVIETLSEQPKGTLLRIPLEILLEVADVAALSLEVHFPCVAQGLVGAYDDARNLFRPKEYGYLSTIVLSPVFAPVAFISTFLERYGTARKEYKEMISRKQ